ncbi:MAG TPA: hypothetical protein ENK06_11140 [Gammaproteobacteria bacterium]|nr:hypothetical protein [Gammaproteobacteria bacterium]
MASKLTPQAKRFVINHDTVVAAGLFFVFVAGTIAFSTTTFSSRGIIEPIRAGSAIIAISLAALQIIFKPKIPKQQGVAIALFALVFFYMLLLHAINGTSLGARQIYVFGILLIAATTFFLAQPKQVTFPPKLVKALFFVFLAMFAITVVLGGISLQFPPHFILEYASRAANVSYDIQYSQGTTKFYGLAAIAAMFLLLNARSRWSRAFYIVTMVGFLLLSLIGGARGESVAAIIVVLFGLLYKNKGTLLIVIGIAVVGLSLLGASNFFELTIVQRFLLIFESAGRRETLLIDAFNLLFEKPECMVFGCGLNFFQKFYGLPVGVYPHNVLVELAISLGLPMTLFLVFSSLVGFWHLIRNVGMRNDALPFFFLYYFLIGLKSGSVIGSSFFVASLFFLSSLTITNLRKNRIPHSSALGNRIQ